MIIDVHGHVLGPGYPVGSEFTTTAEKTREVLHRHNVQQIWMSHTSAMVVDDTICNRQLYEEYVKVYPDTFVGFCVVDPHKGLDHVKAEMRRCKEEYGFKGLKIHGWLQGFGMHDAYIDDMMQIAEEYHWPVIFHDGTPPYADTSQIADLAEKHPNVNVILGHSGLYDSYRAAIQACRDLPNVYLCLVGNTIGSIREKLRQAPHSRILYGSDYCCGNDMEFAGTLIEDRYDSLIEAAEGENVDDILFGNAKQLII